MNRFILFYHLSAAVITAAFLALMGLLRWVWFDIDDVVIGVTGVVVPWSFAVTLTALGSFLYLVALIASDIAALRAGGPGFFRFGGKTLPGIALVLWGALGAVLYLETRGSVWFTPAAGYTVPEALRGADGKAVDTAETWMKKRRPEILKLFETHVYGKIPAGKTRTSFRELSRVENALGGRAVRREVLVTVEAPRGKLEMTVLLYLPKNRRGPVPAFLAMNFYGNQAVHKDPGITITGNWVANYRRLGIRNNRADEASRAGRGSKWPVERIVERGYALATVYYGDVDPDFDDGFRNGVHPLYYRPGQTRPDPGQWGSISAWAWGLSRVMDFLAGDEEIDGERIVVMGHSRLGKTALWAGALDERFAAVVSNNSGCMGAALSRRRYGETVALINKKFPHWFCAHFKKYNDREDDLPVDQHMLIALIAPRPVYVAPASGDSWSDPEGEFISARLAAPVYRLFGFNGLPVGEMPGAMKPFHGRLAWHLRTGRHDVTLWDWERYLDWADRQLGK